jgi:hypothetical protein
MHPLELEALAHERQQALLREAAAERLGRAARRAPGGQGPRRRRWAALGAAVLGAGALAAKLAPGEPG